MKEIYMLLMEWLKIVDQNLPVNYVEIDRISKSDSFREKLYRANYKKLADVNYQSKSKNIKFTSIKNKNYSIEAENLRKEYVQLILETQDYKCALWIPSIEIQPGIYANISWPRPNTFKNKIMTLETDHVIPIINQGKDHLENYMFLSAMANQFVKNQLPFEVVGKIYQSQPLINRVEYILQKRKKLFLSTNWKNFIKKINNFETKKEILQ